MHTPYISLRSLQSIQTAEGTHTDWSGQVDPLVMDDQFISTQGYLCMVNNRSLITLPNSKPGRPDTCNYIGNRLIRTWIVCHGTFQRTNPRLNPHSVWLFSYGK